MGRALIPAQKKALRQYQDKHPEVRSVSDMDSDVWNAIDAMRYCEVNWQNANRFLYDRAMEKLNGK